MVPNESTAHENPVTKYHTGGFPKQEQEQPGLTGEMEPRPDHGENTYVGSGRLKRHTALITGGDSGIGRAVAIAFATKLSVGDCRRRSSTSSAR